MSYLFEIFPAIRCYYSDWMLFYFIYNCQVHLDLNKDESLNILKNKLETLILNNKKALAYIAYERFETSVRYEYKRLSKRV